MISSKFIRLNLFLFFLVAGITAFGQENNFRVSVIYPEGNLNKLQFEDLDKVIYPDSLSALNAIVELRDKYYESGYLAAGLDSLNFSGNEIKAFFNPGIKYEWGRIEIMSDPAPGIGKLPSSITKKSGKILKASDADLIRHEVIALYENNGYPFAAAYFDSIGLFNNKFSTGIFVDPGPAVFVDSIINRSKSAISEKVLEQIIRIKKGLPYSEKKIRIANQQLERSGLLRLEGPIEVGFVDNKAWIYISPEKRRANSFDGLIGLVPGGSTTEKLSLTGSLDLVLNNTFRQAEKLKIFWKAPANQNQRFNAEIEFPWLFGWPIGFSSDFELYKKDSSYLNTEIKLGLITSLGIKNRIGFYFRNKGSNILLNDPGVGLGGYNITTYGFNWKFEDLTNPVNPATGLIIAAELGIGDKEFDSDVPANDRRLHFETSLMADYFIPFSNFLVFNLGLNGAYINGDNTLENEKFRLGGIYSLRGFDEESLPVDKYLIGTAELRYLFSRNSNLHLFMDAGKWWSATDLQNISDIPIGFGMGLSLETNAGIIMLDYALGRSGDIPFNLRSGKIHLGIKSIF